MAGTTSTEDLLRELAPQVLGVLMRATTAWTAARTMLLTDARRAARTTKEGALVPLTEQDRSHWDRRLIAEGTALTERTLATTRALGPYQIQAAIAAVHDEAASVPGHPRNRE